jgi:hypothetical protein
MKKFKNGDRVRLVKPFRCQGDDEEADEDIQRDLIRAFGDEVPVGVVDEYSPSGWLLVDFIHGSSTYTRQLWVDEDVLDFEHPPVSDEEVEAAIRSIIGDDND